MLLVALITLVAVAVVAGKATFTSARFFDQESSSNNVLRAVSDWLDFAWHWRVPITISSGESLDDYQVKITMDTASLIAAGKMQATGDDIRFTDSDGRTLMNYWIDSDMNTTSTVVWVRVPAIPAGISTIYMYYGNPVAPVASSGDATFIFFDDFENGLVDDAKWEVVNPDAGSVSLSTNSFHGTNSLEIIDSPKGTNLGVSARFVPQTSCVIDFAIYFTIQGSKEIQVEDANRHIGPRGKFEKSKGGTDTLQYYVEGAESWSTVGNFRAATWYQSEIAIPNTMTADDKYSLFFHTSAGNPLANATDVPFYQNADVGVSRLTYIGTSDSRTDTYLDLVKVRAYAAAEPTCVMGSEE